MFQFQRLFQIAVFVCSMVAFARSANGETPTNADALFDAGASAFDAKRYEEAAKLWGEAWEKNRSYDLASALAQAEIKLGRWSDAAEHLSFALDSFPVTGKEDLRKTLQDALSRAREQVLELSLEAASGISKVAVDGKLIALSAKGPVRTFVTPGRHVVEATAGTRTEKQTIEGKAGEKRMLRLFVTEQVPRPELWPVVVGGAVALVGLGVGVGGVVASTGKGSEAASQREAIVGGGLSCPSAAGCPALKQTLFDQRTTETVAGVGFVLAGAALAGSAVYWFAPRAKQISPTVEIGPAVGPTIAGLQLRGRF